jgi:hypothetical protein
MASCLSAAQSGVAKDQVWSVMQAARRMEGEITEGEAIAVPYVWKADRLAKYLGVTYQQRRILGITHWRLRPSRKRNGESNAGIRIA